MPLWYTQYSKTGVIALWRAAKEERPETSIAEVTTWLRRQKAYQIHFPKPHVKQYLPIRGKSKDEFWQADLIDIARFQYHNHRFTFLLTIVDVESKYMAVYPLKKKAATDVAAAFQKALERAVPERLQTDNGKEFRNKTFQQLLKDNNIVHLTSEPGDHRATGVIERANRTIMSKVAVYMTSHESKAFVDAIGDIVSGINHTPHRATGLAPVDYTSKAARPKPTAETGLRGWFAEELTPGDTVRIVIDKPLFTKGYSQNWSDATFIIKRKTRIGTYKLQGQAKSYKRYELLKIEAEEKNPFLQAENSSKTKNIPRYTRKKPELDSRDIISGKRSHKPIRYRDFVYEIN